MSNLRKTQLIFLFGLCVSICNAQPSKLAIKSEGACLAKAKKPVPYQVVTKQILVEEARVEVIDIPARYEYIAVGTMVYSGPEGTCMESEVYDVIEEEFVVKEGYELIQESYKAVEEIKVDESGHSGWATTGDSKCNSPTGDCDFAIQWVASPAKYETYYNNKLVGKEVIDEIEPETIIIKRVVIRKPEATRIVKLPVRYATIERERLVAPARKKILHIPAKYKTIQEKIYETEDKTETMWVNVICPNQVDGFVYGQLQFALKARNYWRGRVNGVWGRTSQYALERYQSENDLPIGKFDQATIESLGLNFEMIVNNNGTEEVAAVSAE